eukprot:6476806-Amphidinium_carterae.2
MCTYELHFDVAADEYLLYQGHTDACVKVGRGPVQLSHADGVAYVSTTEWTKWCEDLFHQQVVQKEDESIWVVWTESQKTLTLTEYQQSHSPVSLGIHVWGSSTVMRCPGYVLEHPVEGASLFIGLTDLYNNVLGSSTNMTASRWYQSWLPHWLKRLKPHSLPESHIRRAAVTGHFGRKQTAVFADAIRFYSQPSVSLCALLLLLSRFCGESKSGTQKNAPAQQSWHVFLRSLLHRCFSDSAVFSMVLALDADAFVAAGRPIRGTSYVHLPVRGTKVDMSPLLLADNKLVVPVRLLVTRAWGEIGTCHASVLLHGLQCALKHYFSLLHVLHCELVQC